jgi:hypothetical protein
MKINLDGGASASEKDLTDFQEFLGCQISESVVRFFRSFDGAKPEPNIFSINDKNDLGINKFIPLKSIPQELPYVSGLSRKAYPIAWAEGGNYVVIDESNDGAVYFGDHELAEPLIRIASSFDSFLDQLEPFDVKSIKLNPNQIKKAWIDPEFLRGLKEK